MRLSEVHRVYTKDDGVSGAVGPGPETQVKANLKLSFTRGYTDNYPSTER
jgi:hypothetical protein